jgi:hypothetical protein
LQLGLPLRLYVVFGDDDEVHVAVDVGVADGERSLEVRPAEVVAKYRLDPGHQLGQEFVEVVERCRVPAPACPPRQRTTWCRS